MIRTSFHNNKPGKEESLNHAVGSGGRVGRTAICGRQKNEYQNKNKEKRAKFYFIEIKKTNLKRQMHP